MTMQYWVGDFFIDLSRNQITQNNQSQTIAPKAMEVLTYLAENKGDVVSSDSLLAKVWPDTIVSPNTLQRSIAQLRKALGDDGKVQAYIKTHAKQGYSLECDVSWDDKHNPTTPRAAQPSETKENYLTTNSITENSVTDNDIDKVQVGKAINNGAKAKALKPILSLLLVICVLVVLAILGYQHLAPQQATQLSFNNLRLLTATDDKEFDATYSPDGKYIVFHRYLDQLCTNKVWAKNISTQKETQLTKNWGSYGPHSFSKDGKNLVFLATEACSQPATQKNCYDLVSLDFEKAIGSPQEPNVILQCQNSQVKKPTWLNNGNIALLQRTTQRWKLISYSTSKNESTDLYALKEGNLTSYAYSVKDDIFAVSSIHSDGQHYIEILNSDGHLLSRHLVQYPPEISNFHFTNPSFDSLNNQLVFSTGRQLFTLSYEGKIKKINSLFSDKMSQPTFHPNNNRLLMVKGQYDSDIVLMPRNQVTQTNQTYSSFERSTRGEEQAVFQPKGELIAFLSQRSGDEQLWISDGKNPQQLTHFQVDTYVNGIAWAKDGKSLLVSANGLLTQVFLDATQQLISFEHPVSRLLQWDSENNTALLIARIKGLFKVVEFDLDNAKVKEITDKTVLWAQKTEDGRLIYKDHLGQFWQPGPVEARLIKGLGKQKGKTKSFVLKNNVIFAINSKNELWSYDLNSNEYNVLREVGEEVDYLTDVNQTHFLMSVVVSAKKEVVELSLTE